MIHKFFYFLIILVFLSISNQTFAAVEDNAQTCQSWKTQVFSRLESLKKHSPEDAISTIVSPETTVIFFSEDHWDSSSKGDYSRVLLQLKVTQPRLDCVFLELPETYQSQLDQIASGKMHYQDWVAEMVSDAKEMVASSGGTFTASEADVKQGTDAWLAEESLFIQEPKHEIHLIAVDQSFQQVERLIKIDSDYAVSGRNKFMAENMKKSFESGKCHLAVAINGNEHLFHLSGPSIPEQMNQWGYKSVMVDFANSLLSSGQSPVGCTLPNQTFPVGVIQTENSALLSAYDAYIYYHANETE
jgi:hypothetical protein